jgi:hypothetical protein
MVEGDILDGVGEGANIYKFVVLVTINYSNGIVATFMSVRCGIKLVNGACMAYITIS